MEPWTAEFEMILRLNSFFTHVRYFEVLLVNPMCTLMYCICPERELSNACLICMIGIEKLVIDRSCIEDKG